MSSWKAKVEKNIVVEKIRLLFKFKRDNFLKSLFTFRLGSWPSQQNDSFIFSFVTLPLIIWQPCLKSSGGLALIIWQPFIEVARTKPKKIATLDWNLYKDFYRIMTSSLWNRIHLYNFMLGGKFLNSEIVAFAIFWKLKLIIKNWRKKFSLKVNKEWTKDIYNWFCASGELKIFNGGF